MTYICPMHPEVVSENPGMCPECGMQLVPEKAKRSKRSGGCCHGHEDNSGEKDAAPAGGQGGHEGHDKHAGHSKNIFKAKFWVSFILSIPIVAYSGIAQELLDYRAPAFPGSEYLPLILATIVFFYGGWIFITSAYRELRARLPGMMTLIALAITVAYVYSVAVVLTGSGEPLFWELATLITIMLLGHWLEMRAVTGAQGALKELSELLPDQAEVLRDGKTETIPLAELRKGDIVLVKPGGRVPADGRIKEGESDVNESIVTGESKPVAKSPGDEVIAGTTNGDGSLQIEVTKIGAETFLSGVMRLVAEAQGSKSRLQMLSDRAAYYLTIIAVVGGGATLASWLAFSDAGAGFAINRMVAVLVITCPHALGLAIPLVASISTTKAARNGFLVKQRLALEAARDVDTVLFDKTGTLTRGEFGVERMIPAGDAKEEDILRYAAAVNAHSEHPLAKAMVKAAQTRGMSLPDAKNFKRIPGKGVQAEVDGAKVVVGSTTLAAELGAAPEGELKKELGTLGSEGKTLNLVIRDGRLLGALALADVIREESRAAVRELQAMGLKTAMVTGDDEDVAGWVATELGLDEYFSRVLPEEKSNKVKALQDKGRKVAMVGDGVNDAPALTQADLGIAIGAGTNVAVESAGIILVRDDPRDIAKIIRLSRLTYRKMLQNLFWATGYNVVAIPLAAGVLAFKGILLQPAVAAVLMSLSTVVVSVNAVLLRNKRLDR